MYLGFCDDHLYFIIPATEKYSTAMYYKLLDLERLGSIDRTPGIPGSDKYNNFDLILIRITFFCTNIFHAMTDNVTVVWEGCE